MRELLVLLKTNRTIALRGFINTWYLLPTSVGTASTITSAEAQRTQIHQKRICLFFCMGLSTAIIVPGIIVGTIRRQPEHGYHRVPHNSELQSENTVDVCLKLVCKNIMYY